MAYQGWKEAEGTEAGEMICILEYERQQHLLPTIDLEE